MLEKWIIIKYGKSPHVYYGKSLLENSENNKIVLDFDSQNLLDKWFCSFDVNGKRLDGALWFQKWCDMRNLSVKKQFIQFVDKITVVNSFRDSCGMIAKWFWKLKKQVKDCYLNWLLYLDVYQIGQFGRSRLGNLAFYAKQSQSKKLLEELWNITKWQIDCFLSKEKFDWVCFAPHSLKRNIQILDFLKKKWDIWLQEIYLRKFYQWDIIIPQKSIKWNMQRIRNARETIFVVNWQKSVNKLLLIDDFVWSGATLNESAHKLKKAWLAKNIVWLALVWNVDMTYEVINEV